MFLSEWREFTSAPCLAGGKKTWWQLTSRCCWNRARPWYASGLASFLVGLRTYQHTGVGVTVYLQQSDVYYQHCLNMFRASLCSSSGEQYVCYWMLCAALVLLVVVGSGCGALRCGVWASWTNLHSARSLQLSAPQPLPTTSSRTSAAHHMQ